MEQADNACQVRALYEEHNDAGPANTVSYTSGASQTFGRGSQTFYLVQTVLTSYILFRSLLRYMGDDLWPTTYLYGAAT